MSGTPNASSAGSTHEITVTNGIATLEGVNATTLGNITYDYQPEGGQYRRAAGLLPVTTATATPEPAIIYVGESTDVTITLTHPATGEPIANTLVGIDEGLNLNQSILAKIPTSDNTGSDGKVIFGITAEATGNATIYVKSGTDPSNPHVIKAEIRQTMTVTTDVSAVYEGNGFTVTVEDSNDNALEGVTITFNGNTYTTGSTGQASIPASGLPDVPTTPGYLPYTVKATKTGYTTATSTIQVLNKPKIYITIEGATIDKDGNYKLTAGKVVVKAGGDDGNEFGITITIKKGETVVQTGTAPLTVNLEGEEGTYTLTATKTDYQPADAITLKTVSYTHLTLPTN